MLKGFSFIFMLILGTDRLPFFFGRVRYCITFIVAVSTLLFVRKLIR